MQRRHLRVRIELQNAAIHSAECQRREVAVLCTDKNKHIDREEALCRLASLPFFLYGAECIPEDFLHSLRLLGPPPAKTRANGIVGGLLSVFLDYREKKPHGAFMQCLVLQLLAELVAMEPQLEEPLVETISALLLSNVFKCPPPPRERYDTATRGAVSFLALSNVTSPCHVGGHVGGSF
eukprot:Polyplicarium_translucidae@DN3125_c0_g1_i4.p3